MHVETVLHDNTSTLLTESSDRWCPPCALCALLREKRIQLQRVQLLVSGMCTPGLYLRRSVSRRAACVKTPALNS